MLSLVPLAMTLNLLMPPASAPLAVATMLPQSAAPLPRIGACSLLSKEEVKKHLPWQPMLDNLPVEEDEIGPSGSACNYPSVHVQVLANPQSMIDSARKRGGLEPIGGVGDEAYFHNNKNRFAELFVRVGKRILTLQASIPMDSKAESLKPGMLSLAKALASKLPR